jgi:hypothetical protein
MGSKTMRIISILYILCASLGMNSQQWNEIQFIGNQTGVSAFSPKEITDIFRAKYTFWKNNIPVTICLPQSQSPEANEIYGKLYEKSVNEVKKFWLSQVFQGRSRSPQFFNTQGEMIDYIAKTPGAIGAITSGTSLKIPENLKINIRD